MTVGNALGALGLLMITIPFIAAWTHSKGDRDLLERWWFELPLQKIVFYQWALRGGIATVILALALRSLGK